MLFTLCKYHIFSVLCGILIFILCVIKIPQQEVPINFPNIDKIVHFTMYFTFSLLYIFENLLSNPAKKKKPLTLYLITIFLSLMIGGVIEIIQSDLTTYRSGDIIDWLFDISGAITAIAIAAVYRLITIKH
jgi:VanZ family protein